MILTLANLQLQPKLHGVEKPIVEPNPLLDTVLC